MNYIQISIAANEEQQELLISILSLLDTTGFEQTETHLIAYFEEDNFKSYEVNDALKDFFFQINTIHEQNWNDVWEKNFQPVIIDDFCAIRAHFHEPIKNVQHQIIITPKMSFGTGHHATTYMMIEGMKEIIFSGKTVFDFGTGTGILAILAEKLGAANIWAIDTDKYSIENAQENIEGNNSTKIQLGLSSVIPLQKFDVILANINKNVILSNLNAIAKACNEKTLVLLSGLLTEDEKEIVEACQQNNLMLVKQRTMSNWICLLVNRKV
jgi:ribosomal protein L11 methyltransferase